MLVSVVVTLVIRIGEWVGGRFSDTQSEMSA
jgi:hypothetical protein